MGYKRSLINERTKKEEIENLHRTWDAPVNTDLAAKRRAETLSLSEASPVRTLVILGDSRTEKTAHTTSPRVKVSISSEKTCWCHWCSDSITEKRSEETNRKMFCRVTQDSGLHTCQPQGKRENHTALSWWKRVVRDSNEMLWAIQGQPLKHRKGQTLKSQLTFVV